MNRFRQRSSAAASRYLDSSKARAQVCCNPSDRRAPTTADRCCRFRRVAWFTFVLSSLQCTWLARFRIPRPGRHLSRFFGPFVSGKAVRRLLTGAGTPAITSLAPFHHDIHDAFQRAIVDDDEARLHRHSKLSHCSRRPSLVRRRLAYRPPVRGIVTMRKSAYLGVRWSPGRVC